VVSFHLLQSSVYHTISNIRILIHQPPLDYNWRLCLQVMPFWLFPIAHASWHVIECSESCSRQTSIFLNCLMPRMQRLLLTRFLARGALYSPLQSLTVQRNYRSICGNERMGPTRNIMVSPTYHTWRRMDEWRYSSTISDLDCRFIPWWKTLGTHFIGLWFRPRARLDAME
jgi:hypothetical protein